MLGHVPKYCFKGHIFWHTQQSGPSLQTVSQAWTGHPQISILARILEKQKSPELAIPKIARVENALGHDNT